VAEARRTLGGRLRRLVQGGVIDARAGLKKIAHGRGFFLRAQRRLVVVDAERADRLRQVHLAALDGIADQRVEHALTHGSERRFGGRVAPLRDHGAAVQDHHGGRTDQP
jgi:hypothetical protein